MTLQLFVFLATLFFLILGIIWSKKSWGNVLIKLICIFLAIWGIFETAKLKGYILKKSEVTENISAVQTENDFPKSP